LIESDDYGLKIAFPIEAVLEQSSMMTVRVQDSQPILYDGVPLRSTFSRTSFAQQSSFWLRPVPETMSSSFSI